MKKHLYEIFTNTWLRECDSLWIYSDPHFGDLDSYSLRFPEIEKLDVAYLDEMQIKNINAKCGKNSCLILLGDIGDINCVSKLKAKYKILILGNHDKGVSNYKRVQNYILDYEHGTIEIDLREYRIEDNHLFDEIYEGPLFINNKLVLSHEPLTGYGNYFYNIHGHVHNAEYKGDSTHMNVCAEAINYEPVNLLKLLKEGLLKNIDDIHRQTIDFATERKNKKKK